MLVLAVFLISLTELVMWFGIGRSYASVTPGPSKLALIKQNDLAGVGRKYAPDFQWIACGLTTAPLYAPRPRPCRKGQVPVYASYWTLKKAIADQTYSIVSYFW